MDKWAEPAGDDRQPVRRGRMTAAPCIGPGRGRGGDPAAAVRGLGRAVRTRAGTEPPRGRPSSLPFTYDELDRRASVLALALARDVGVRRGELVALICDNRPEWMVCSLAIHFLGAVDVPRATETPAEILETILRHAEPAVVILEDPAQLPLVRGAVPGLRAVVVIGGPDHAPDPPPATGASADAHRTVRSPERAALRRPCTPWSISWRSARRRGPRRRRGPAAARGGSARRPGDRHLHLGHDRHAQGRGAHARQLRAQPAASSPNCSRSSACRCSACCSRGTPTSGRCSSCT